MCRSVYNSYPQSQRAVLCLFFNSLAWALQTSTLAQPRYNCEAPVKAGDQAALL